MAPRRSALALACAAAALAVGDALNSLPAAGVPCSTVGPSNPSSATGSAPTCDATLTPFDYYGAMKAGTLNLAQLGLDTNGGCDFIEDAFEETFNSPVLNFTRWLPDELDGQEHCIGLPPAGPTTCTMMMTQQVQLAQTFPATLGGGSGAILTLSQDPCVANPASCCNSKNTTCARWAGAHLVSAGCIQYGVLEIEAAFNMPANSGGFYFTATYVVYGTTDASWNEIDVGMINNILGSLEFHATVFTADKDTATVTQMDALNFAQAPIGTSINVNTTIKTINGLPAPQVYYNTSFASTFHTYKVVWTHTSVAWMVDRVVYRNISYAPWRPMSIRQILRTNKGINAVGPQYTASYVYLRRIRYTPLSDQAVADAFRCTSMFACYGAMAAAPMGVASTFISLGSTTPPSAGRRHLLQAVVDNGAVLEGAVAAIVPGMPAANVTATPSAFGLTFRLTLTNLGGGTANVDALSLFQEAALQAPLVAGVADDVVPGPDNIMVQDVSEDATGTYLYVNVLVTGYADASEMTGDYTMFSQRGAAELDSTAAELNNALGLVSTPYITAANVTSSLDPNYTPVPVVQPPSAAAILSNSALCPSYPASWDSTCVDANGNAPSVWCANCVLIYMDQLNMLTTYSVAVPVAASAVSTIEAQLNSAMTSGAMAGALTASRRRSRSLLQSGPSDVNLTSTNSLLIQRMMSSASAPDAATVAAAAELICSQQQSREAEWRAAAIAFIVLFGSTIVTISAFQCGKRTERKALASMALSEPKMLTDTLA